MFFFFFFLLLSCFQLHQKRSLCHEVIHFTDLFSSSRVSPVDMALCGSVRGGFRAGVGVMLLGLSLAQPVPGHAACPTAVTPLNLTQPEYQDTAAEDTIAGFMSALVQSFLHTVQPRPFPKGECHQCYSDIKHLDARVPVQIVCDIYQTEKPGDV